MFIYVSPVSLKTSNTWSSERTDIIDRQHSVTFPLVLITGWEPVSQGDARLRRSHVCLLSLLGEEGGWLQGEKQYTLFCFELAREILKESIGLFLHKGVRLGELYPSITNKKK